MLVGAASPPALGGKRGGFEAWRTAEAEFVAPSELAVKNKLITPLADS